MTTSSLPIIARSKNASGVTEFHLLADPVWDGFDSLVKYLQKHWNAEVCEAVDNIYSRRWVLRANGVPISVYHDSQIGNYFLREDSIRDESLLENIESDLIRRLS
jgi:hypothetical protein